MSLHSDRTQPELPIDRPQRAIRTETSASNRSEFPTANPSTIPTLEREKHSVATGLVQANGLIANLELDAVVGSGGMGQVYRGHDGTREVAVKFLSAHYRMDPAYVNRFRREHAVLQKLLHPNIVTVYDIATDGSHFTMEFIEGKNLKQWREEQTDIDLRLVARIVRDMALAIEYANRSGVVHRDLKPSNVLITDLDGSPMPKVIDFGIAMMQDATHLTASGVAMGSMDYLPPENLSDDLEAKRRPTVDVYGLGGILYFLLSGRTPFADHASTVHELLNVIRNKDIVPKLPRVRGTHADQKLETICLRCLSKEPSQRYASAGDLANDLQRYLDGQPVHAQRDQALRRAKRFLRRNSRSIAAVSLASTCALMMGLLWNRAVSEKRKSDRIVHSLLGVMDSQIQVLDGQTILKSRENQQVFEALLSGYRINHSNLTLSDLSPSEAVNHAYQLLRISKVAFDIGLLEQSDEFLDYFRSVESVHATDAPEDWLALRFAQRLQLAQIRLEESRYDLATQASEHALQLVPSADDPTWLRRKADATHVQCRAQFLKHRRGPKLRELGKQALSEIALREKVFAQSRLEHDAILLGRAQCLLGRLCYKGGIHDLRNLPDSIRTRMETLNEPLFISASEAAKATIAKLEKPDAPEALLIVGEAQNTLGLYYAIDQPEVSLKIHQSNLELYENVHKQLPLVVDHHVAVARSHGNIADAYYRDQRLRECLEARKRAFGVYEEIQRQHGNQRDVAHDLAVHGARLYHLAVRLGEIDEADSVRNRLFEMVSDPSFAESDSPTQQIYALALICDHLDALEREHAWRRENQSPKSQADQTSMDDAAFTTRRSELLKSAQLAAKRIASAERPSPGVLETLQATLDVFPSIRLRFPDRSDSLQKLLASRITN